MSCDEHNNLALKNLQILKCIVELRIEKSADKLRGYMLIGVDYIVFKSLLQMNSL